MRKGTAIVLVVVGIALLLTTIALLIVAQSRNYMAGKVSSDREYANILSDIPDITSANPHIVDLAMLGSHDASTYTLSKAAVGFSGEVKKVNKGLYKLAEGLALRYTKTQVSSIYDQLCQGVRYLHIKCTYFDGDWYGSHSIIDGKLEIYIKDVIRFLQEHPGEIAVLELQIMYAEGSSVAEFTDRLFNISYEGETLAEFMPFENADYGDVTYNWLTRSGTKGGAMVMLVNRDDAFEEDGFWDNYESSVYHTKYSASKCLYAPWYNRMDTSALAKAIDKRSEFIRNEADRYEVCFCVMQINATPTRRDAADTAFAWSLLNKAKTHNSKILSDPSFDKWLEQMPIVMCDFSTSANGDFNHNINQKLIAYNTKLVNSLLSAS